MKHVIDPELIILASPDYAYGRRLGLTDEETERSTLETMDAMKKAYDKTLPVKPEEYSTCGECGTALWEDFRDNPNYCRSCGQAIDWEVPDVRNLE